MKTTRADQVECLTRRVAHRTGSGPAPAGVSSNGYAESGGFGGIAIARPPRTWPARPASRTPVEQSGRTTVAGDGQGQNTPSLGVDPGVVDAGVVGPRPPSPAGVFEYERGVGVERHRTEPAGQLGQNLQIARAPRPWPVGPARRMNRPPDWSWPSSSAHCVVGSTTSAMLAVSDSTSRRPEQSSRERRSWTGARGADTTGFETEHEQTPRVRPPCPAGRTVRPRKTPATGRSAAGMPHARNVFAPTGSSDLPVARKLIRLLAVFAAALPVALTGQTAVPATGPSCSRARAPD